MEKISKKVFLEILESEKIAMKVKSAAREENFCIDFLMELHISEEDNMQTGLEYVGYKVESEDGKVRQEMEFETIEKLIGYLEEVKVIENDEVEVVLYCNRYHSYEEYLSSKKFEDIDMAGLLSKYSPHADRFSLTGVYGNNFSRKKPFGDIKLSEEDAKHAIGILRDCILSKAKNIYKKLGDDEKAELLPFEKLITSIEQEIAEYRLANRKKIDKNDGEAFYCDRFSMGKAKYKSPQELWHIYHNLDFFATAQWICNKMQKNKVEVPLDEVLNEKYYSQLKKYLQKIEVTFTWHCTMTNQLSKIFYFELNNATIEWLKELKDDYDMKELQDLAFYKGEELLFSSCTHEGFHVDCLDSKDGKN